MKSIWITLVACGLIVGCGKKKDDKDQCDSNASMAACDEPSNLGGASANETEDVSRKTEGSSASEPAPLLELTPGGPITISNVSKSSFTVSWPPATDPKVPQELLSYWVATSTPGYLLDTVEKFYNIPSIGWLLHWERVTSITSTNLMPGSQLSLNVMVTNHAGKFAIYKPVTIILPTQ